MLVHVLQDERHLGRTDCARPVLALVHGTVHASLEESASRAVGAGCDKLVELVDISLEIAPDETRVALGRLAGAELELLADKEDTFLVGYSAISETPRRTSTSRTLFLVV